MAQARELRAVRMVGREGRAWHVNQDPWFRVLWALGEGRGRSWDRDSVQFRRSVVSEPL